MDTRRDVFHAIADPTRRDIIGLIAQGSLNFNSITEQFDVSRQAISVHIKVLNECGLVTITKRGREKVCSAKLDRLKEVVDWTQQYKQFWSVQFDALEKYLKRKKSN